MPSIMSLHSGRQFKLKTKRPIEQPRRKNLEKDKHILIIIQAIFHSALIFLHVLKARRNGQWVRGVIFCKARE